ncbi:uncharacterized protein [Magallana gigas]|uniref:uncharacterized protein n=1 Tax=Magallana gigas TaxID=29159 RepID=UPI00333ECE7F
MITSYDGYSILDCVEDCLRTTRCRSINYYQGAHFCKTNFENRTTVPGLYIEKPGWIYSDIEDWDKEIAGACSRSSCRINEKCIPQPFDQFTCVISDCGEPRGEGFSMEHVREWDAIGITRGMHITCAAKYNQLGSELFVCRSNGTSRTDLSCHKNYVCEKSTMNLKCPPGKINIEYANYGRTDDNICTQKTSSKTDCRYENSEKIVKSQCDGKTYCSITASNEVFTDPCGSTPKYLEIKFTCV